MTATVHHIADARRRQLEVTDQRRATATALRDAAVELRRLEKYERQEMRR